MIKLLIVLLVLGYIVAIFIFTFYFMTTLSSKMWRKGSAVLDLTLTNRSGMDEEVKVVGTHRERHRRECHIRVHHNANQTSVLAFKRADFNKLN